MLRREGKKKSIGKKRNGRKEQGQRRGGTGRKGTEKTRRKGTAYGNERRCEREAKRGRALVWSACRLPRSSSVPSGQQAVLNVVVVSQCRRGGRARRFSYSSFSWCARLVASPSAPFCFVSNRRYARPAKFNWIKHVSPIAVPQGLLLLRGLRTAAMDNRITERQQRDG